MTSGLPPGRQRDWLFRRFLGHPGPLVVGAIAAAIARITVAAES